jgi:two-component system LytT family response regulator
VLQGVVYHNFSVIFTTAYDHYAVKAIKFSAVDYLLKPIDVDELQAAVQKVSEKMQNNTSQQTLQLLLKNLQKPADTDFSITLATSEGLEFVPLQQIIRLEASGTLHSFLHERRQKDHGQ